MTGLDTRHGGTGANANPQHLRYAETTATTLERPPRADERRKATQTTHIWRCCGGLTSTGSRWALQRYSENLPEAPADQPGKQGRPRSGPTYVEENSEDRRSNLRGQPHHRRRRQTRDTQMSTAAAAASQCQRPTNSNEHIMSTDIPEANWTCATPSDQLHHSDCANRCPSIHHN
ncbi:hypothetical protein SprV_0200840300 [Sparganum proliferum]